MKQRRQGYVWAKRIAVYIIAYLCLLSVKQLYALKNISSDVYGVTTPGFNLWMPVVYLLIVRLMYRCLERRDRRLIRSSLVGGVLLSMAVVYGTYAHFVNDIFTDARTAFLQLGMIFCLLSLTVPLSEEILLGFDKMRTICMQTDGQKAKTVKKQNFFLFWAAIFVAYLPMFLANWPGNFVFDAKYQMAEVVNNSYSTHHPLAHTLLMGWAYKRGLAFGNVSEGYQIYTLLQMLILSGSFAYTVYYLYSRKTHRILWVGSLLWFAFFPMHALFAISATKDVLFAASFLLFMIFMVRLLFDKERFSWHSYVGLWVSGVLAMLLRNNCVYAIVAGGILLVILDREMKKRLVLLGMIAAMLAGYKAGNGALIAATNAVSKDTYRESLSVPLQCLARVACYHRDTIDEETYREICAYIREEDLTAYNPYNADAVKNEANEIALRENTVSFLKLVIKLGLQHPDEYVESVVTNTLGYWYPLERGTYAETGISLYHTLIGTGAEIEKHSYCKWAEKIYNYLFYEEKYRETPILGYLFRTDLYVWMLLYLILWGVYQRDPGVNRMALIPFLYLGTCFLGPMAALRYLYCLIVLTPLVLYLIINTKDGVPSDMED